MNGGWLRAAGAGRQYAPASLGGAPGRPLNFTVRRRCCSVRASALVATTAAFAGFGPPLGLLVVFIGGFLYGVLNGHGIGNALLMLLPPVPLFFLPLAFRFGAVPAVSTGLVIALLAHNHPGPFLRHPWKRAVISGVIGGLMGALWGLVSLGHVVVHQQLSTVTFDLLFDCVIAGISAAILGIFFPRRAWVAAPSNNRWSGP